MAVLFEYDVETPANGVTLQTSNTPFNNYIQGLVTASNAFAAVGTQSMRSECQGAPAAGNISLPAPATRLYVRAYVYVSALTNTVTILNAGEGAANRAEVRIFTDGRIMLRRSYSNQWVSSTGTFKLNTWYRLEWELIAMSGQRLRMYEGANMHGTTPTLDSGTATFDNGNVGDITFGFTNNVSGSVMFTDAMKIADDAWIGPAVAAPPGRSGKARIWTGTAWAERSAKAWNGSAWVDHEMKAWNGAEWVVAK